jgi:hypothetical protein
LGEQSARLVEQCIQIRANIGRLALGECSKSLADDAQPFAFGSIMARSSTKVRP